MGRYANLLFKHVEESDPFAPQLLKDPKSQKKGTLLRQMHRRLTYPLAIMAAHPRGIVHILDHSWADMFPYCGKKAKKVATLHDLIPLRYPGELGPGQVRRFRKWVQHLHDADAIISVSEYTKQEAIELLGLPAEKIHIVPNGVEIHDPATVPLRPRDEDVFRIGSIGSALQRKNLGIFVEALRILKNMTSRPFALVRAGSMLPPFIADPLRTMLGERGFIEHGTLADGDLPGYYASLDCMVVPSLYEGFGLPVLEAMAARVPVLSSNRTSLPEVGRDVPIYFDPDSPQQLADAISRAMGGEVCEERLGRGLGIASEMSWRKSLCGIYSVYGRIMA